MKAVGFLTFSFKGICGVLWEMLLLVLKVFHISFHELFSSQSAPENMDRRSSLKSSILL